MRAGTGCNGVIPVPSRRRVSVLNIRGACNDCFCKIPLSFPCVREVLDKCFKHAGSGYLLAGVWGSEFLRVRKAGRRSCDSCEHAEGSTTSAAGGEDVLKSDRR